MDEDSGQMTAGEMYDGRGELWRVQEVGQAPIIVQKLRLAGQPVGSGFTISLQVDIWCCSLNQVVRLMP